MMRELRNEYQAILTEVLGELGQLYAKVDNGEKLDYKDVVRFNDIERLQSRVMAQSVRLGTFHREKMQKLLEDSYDFSYSFMSYVVEMEKQVLLANATPNLPYILMQVYDNPITGLYLPTALESNRKKIVQDINGAIEDGLKQGEAYGSIAKRIQTAFSSSYDRATTIARTEVHRVKERATMESAVNIDKQGIRMGKTWRSMQDERVRHTKRADHTHMNGQHIPVEDMFVTITGKQGMTAGNIENSPEDNINCRCIVTYRILRIDKMPEKQQLNKTFEDWQQMKRGA